MCYAWAVEFPSWIEKQWFNVVQTLGIITGSALTAWIACADARSRRAGNLLEMAAQHRELWSEAHRRPELARIFKEEADLVSTPISTAEEEYLRLIIVHFNTGWTMRRAGASYSGKTLSADIRAFFKLPLPAAIWEQTKNARDQGFVKFVENSLKQQ